MSQADRHPRQPSWIVGVILRGALQHALVGRERVLGRAEAGRFTKRDSHRLLARAWEIQRGLGGRPDVERTFGARINVWLASLTLAFHRALVEDGVAPAWASELVGDVAWQVYRRWGQVPALVARLATRDPVRRLRICTDLFRRFPFNPPSYVMQDVEAEGEVGFLVRRCPVAQYFGRQGAADVCVRTWCSLDFALAETWGGSLHRSGTIAGGAELCDFRWRPAPATTTTARGGGE